MVDTVLWLILWGYTLCQSDSFQIDASFLPDPAASIAMNSQHRSLVSTQELGIDFTATAFSRKALNQKRKEIELLITGYNLGVDYIKMHPQKEWEQVLIEK